MAQTIKLKRSATASAIPSTAQLALGEIAINTFDGKLYLKKDNGTESVVEVLTSYAETDTLDSVTDRGATTTNAVTVGNLTSTGIDDNATSTAITIDSSQNIGIGVISPESLLHLKAAAGDAVIIIEADPTDTNENDTPAILLRADGSTGFSALLKVIGGSNQDAVGTLSNALLLGTSGTRPLQFSTNGTVRATINESGNIGIGETNPTTALDVNGSIQAVQTTGTKIAFGPTTFVSGSSTIADYGITYNDEGLSFDTNLAGFTNMKFHTNRTERLRISPNGNVGIGTTNPTTALDVNGTVTATSFSGDGSNLTGISAGVSTGKAIAMAIVFG
jgi:hypothetical protein